MARPSFGGFMKPADPKIHLNLGFPFDNLTGHPIVLDNGQTIINGGQHLLTGVGGRGNTNKTILSLSVNLRIVARCVQSILNVYDAEISLGEQRVHGLAMLEPEIAELDLVAMGRLILTNSIKMSGNNWFAQFKQVVVEKVKANKEGMATAPMKGRDGKNIVIPYPDAALIDSISAFPLDNVEAIYEKNEIGSSGINVESMKANAAKSQMIVQMPALTGLGSIYTTMVAHMGDGIQIDPHAPQQKKLAGLKHGLKFKNTPEKYTFLMNNLWHIYSSVPLQHKETRTPQYPSSTLDKEVGDTDLQLMTVINERGKGGPTGIPFNLIVSQREGILFPLTAYHYLNMMKDPYGLVGKGKVTQWIEFYPEVTFGRTTIRTKSQEDYKLSRALELTAELAQLMRLRKIPDQDHMSAEQIKKTLDEKGYDWGKILNTRGWYIFKEDEAYYDQIEHLKYQITAYDLLNMCKGTYNPDHFKK